MSTGAALARMAYRTTCALRCVCCGCCWYGAAAILHSALLVCIPKGGATLGSVGYEAMAAQLRLLTLSNSCQMLVTKAVGASLWELLFDLIARRLVARLPPRGYALTCFADDLATALRNLVLGLRLLVPVLLETLPAAGLALHVGKNKVLLLLPEVRSTFVAFLPTFLWLARWSLCAAMCTSTCPLVWILWGASSTGLDEAHGSFAPVPTVYRGICRKGLQAFARSVCVAMFRAVAELPAWASVLEGAALAGILAALVYASIVSVHSSRLRSRFCRRLLPACGVAVPRGYASFSMRRDGLEIYDARLTSAQECDEALLAPPAHHWITEGVLQRLRRARRSALHNQLFFLSRSATLRWYLLWPRVCGLCVLRLVCPHKKEMVA